MGTKQILITIALVAAGVIIAGIAKKYIPTKFGGNAFEGVAQ